MRLLFAMGLLFLVLFASVASYAINEPAQSSGVAAQLGQVSCQNPEIITEVHPKAFFAGPKNGWQEMIVESKTVHCRSNG